MFRSQYASFCLTLTEQIRAGCLTHPETEKCLVDFIRLSGYLAFHGASQGAEPPDLLVIANLLPFLSAVIVDRETGQTPCAARRHAWGILGSIATLYALNAAELHGDPNPEQHFRFDTFKPDDIAVGLLRALMLSSVEDGFDIEPHCERCRLRSLEHVRLLFRLSDESLEATMVWRAFKETSTVALKAVVALWKTEDPESVGVRECLRRHGLSSRLQPFLQVGGETTELANEAMTKVFDGERDTPPQSPGISR